MTGPAPLVDDKKENSCRTPADVENYSNMCLIAAVYVAKAADMSCPRQAQEAAIALCLQTETRDVLCTWIVPLGLADTIIELNVRGA